MNKNIQEKVKQKLRELLKLMDINVETSDVTISVKENVVTVNSASKEIFVI